MESITFEPSNILLIFPPQCETALQGPHLAIPQLVSYLKTKGFNPHSIDLNIIFFRYLASSLSLSKQLYELSLRRDELHNKSYLSEDELKELLVLCQVEAVQEWISKLSREFVPKNIMEFRRCSFIIESLLKKLPSNFEEIIRYVSQKRETPISLFYEKIDITNLCSQTALLGISVAFHSQLYPALELARRVKDLRGDAITIVLGGSQLSLMTETQKRRLVQLPYVNAVAVHEGELPLLRICDQLCNQSPIDFSLVPNVYHKNGDEICSPFFTPPVALDELPTPEFQENELKLYLRPVSLPVFVSKGCYWGKCKFCDYTKLYTPGQAKSAAWATFRHVEIVLQDLYNLYNRHRINSFLLISEAITPRFYRKLSQRLIEVDMEINLWSYCRVEKVYDYKYFKLLQHAGVRSLTFGVESTEDRILKLIDKGNGTIDIQRTIRLAQAAGIEVNFNLIPDYPTITWKEVEHSIRFILENIDFITNLNYQFFDLSINSVILNEADKHSIIVNHKQPDSSNHGLHNLSYLRKGDLSEDKIQRLKKLYAFLSSEIEVYKRSRDILARTNSDDFQWDSARFVLADDIESYRLYFDPSEPDRTAEKDLIYKRLSNPILILACPTTRRYLAGPISLQLIMNIAYEKGEFSLDDVVTSLENQFGPANSTSYRNPIEQCIRKLIQEGFIKSVYHPWIGTISENIAEVVNPAVN